MPVYFLDTSALLKRYVVEVGTSWIQGLVGPPFTNQVAIATISGAELIAAVARRRRGGNIPIADANRIVQNFRRDFVHDFDVIDIASPVIDGAMTLADRYALRGYDAVQLAAAAAIRPPIRAAGDDVVFVSADRELNAAAAAEGFAVEDPNAHP